MSTWRLIFLWSAALVLMFILLGYAGTDTSPYNANANELTFSIGAVSSLTRRSQRATSSLILSTQYFCLRLSKKKQLNNWSFMKDPTGQGGFVTVQQSARRHLPCCKHCGGLLT
jgi:hypothetical protein